MIKKKYSKLEWVIGIIFLLYFVIDIVHFFMFRINYQEQGLMEGYYENKILSFMKWIFCILILTPWMINIKMKKLSFYFVFISTIGIIMLFILKGKWNYLLRGSIPLKICLLEIGSILTFIYSVKYLKRSCQIKNSSVLFILIISVVLFYFIIIDIIIRHPLTRTFVIRATGKATRH